MRQFTLLNVFSLCSLDYLKFYLASKSRLPIIEFFGYTFLKLALRCIYLACLSICLFVSNKRQNGGTDRAQILCGPHMTPGKVYRSNFPKMK